MEKRMIAAIALSIAVLVAWQILFSPAPPKGPQPPPGAAPPTVGDNAAAPGVAPQAAAPKPAAGKGALTPRTSSSPRRIAVRTPLYTASVTTEDGGIESFLLHEYKTEPGPAGRPLEIVGSGSFRPLPFDLYTGEASPLPLRPVFAADAPGEIVVGPGEKKSLLLTWESAGGVRISREYVFDAGRYDFEIRAQVSNGSPSPLAVRPGLELSQDFRGELASDSYTFTGLVLNVGGSMETFDLKTIGKGKVGQVPVRWAAADSKYFALILMPEKPWTVVEAARVGENGMRMAAAEGAATLGPGDSIRIAGRGFAGPKKTDILAASGKDLVRLVDYGWFSVLAKPLVWLMKTSHRATRNYGIDIIILTILIKIVFYPLQNKSMASMRKMQDLQPIMSKLREKHKGDTARINQEMMNLYRTYKVNPFSGCLPMLLQIPVFIALYKALLVTIELRHSPFALWINDLSAPEHLWDIHLAGYAIPIRILPLLMGASMFLQQKMTPTAGMEPAQQKMMLFLPLVFTFMFWSFPTGLVIYWLVQNILSIGQQLLYNRQIEAARQGA